MLLSVGVNYVLRQSSGKAKVFTGTMKCRSGSRVGNFGLCISRNFLIWFLIIIFVRIWGFLKFLWIEISDGSWGVLSSGWASESLSPDDWGGRMLNWFHTLPEPLLWWSFPLVLRTHCWDHWPAEKIMWDCKIGQINRKFRDCCEYLNWHTFDIYKLSVLDKMEALFKFHLVQFNFKAGIVLSLFLIFAHFESRCSYKKVYF